jgi:hypothetical protein
MHGSAPGTGFPAQPRDLARASRSGQPMTGQTVKTRDWSELAEAVRPSAPMTRGRQRAPRGTGQAESTDQTQDKYGR